MSESRIYKYNYMCFSLTMFAPNHIQILAQMRMTQRSQKLRLAHDRNRIGRQWKPVAIAHIARM